MFVKTFLVGLLLTLKAARAYIERNQDGVKDHTTSEEWLKVLNALDAIVQVIDFLLGSPILALGKRVSRTNPAYIATLSKLRENDADWVRIPARVVRREDAPKWL